MTTGPSFISNAGFKLKVGNWWTGLKIVHNKGWWKAFLRGGDVIGLTNGEFRYTNTQGAEATPSNNYLFTRQMWVCNECWVRSSGVSRARQRTSAGCAADHSKRKQTNKKLYEPFCRVKLSFKLETWETFAPDPEIILLSVAQYWQKEKA